MNKWAHFFIHLKKSLDGGSEMKIEMRCPNGHREIIDDSRFSIPDSQKAKFWLSKEYTA